MRRWVLGIAIGLILPLGVSLVVINIASERAADTQEADERARLEENASNEPPPPPDWGERTLDGIVAAGRWIGESVHAAIKRGAG